MQGSRRGRAGRAIALRKKCFWPSPAPPPQFESLVNPTSFKAAPRSLSLRTVEKQNKVQVGVASSSSPSETLVRHYYRCRVLPPDKSAQDRRDLVTHLIDTVDLDCGIVILGDFNDQDTSDLLSSHGLKQLVSNPIRFCANPNLVLSNLKPSYAPPSILAPLGTSDHNIVKWYPSTSSNGCLNKVKNKISTRLARRYPHTVCESFGSWIIKQGWRNSVSAHPCSANELASSFTPKISQAMEIFFPTSVVKSHYSDKPWMTSPIKKLIAKRQKAYNSGDKNAWLFYRNMVKSTIAWAKQELLFRQNRT